MGRLKNLDAIQTIGSDYTPSADTSSYDAASTPVETNQLYDYTQNQQDTYNPYNDSGSTDMASTSTPEPVAPEPTPQTTTEAERAEAAHDQNANLNAALEQNTHPDPVASMQQAGLDTDTISALQQIDKYAHTKSPEEFQRGFATIASQNKAVADLYMQYYVNGTQPTQAPAQQPVPQNQILPSAGGNYQADSIYDPNKTYGRQPDGSYNYSYSARELQNNLAREGYYKGAIDGYFGQQTRDALDAYLADNGIKANNGKASAGPNADVPMSQAGSMSQAQQAAQNTTQQQNQNQNTNQANTFLEQIQRGWDRLWHGDNNTPSAEPTQGSTASSSQPVPDYEPYSFDWFVDEYKTENPNATDEEARNFAGQQITGMQNGDISRPRDSFISDDIRNGWRRFIGLEETPNNSFSMTARTLPDSANDSDMARREQRDFRDRGQPWNLTVDSLKEDLTRMEEEGNAGVQEGQFAKNNQQYGLWHTLHPYGTLDDYYRIYPNRAPDNYFDTSDTNTTIGRDSANDAGMAMEEQLGIRREERERLAELQRQAEMNSIINGNNNLPEDAPPMQISNGNRQEQTLGDALSALTFKNGVQIPQALNGANKSSGLLSWIAPEASADEMEQPQATGEVYGTPGNSNDNYREELERIQNGGMASDDIQSSAGSSTMLHEGEPHFGDSMSRALADNQARPNTNIFAQDTPPVVSPQREEQYKTLFDNEIAALKQMYPDASYNQLYDYLRLFYEQNGDTDTEYYRWFNSFL